MSKRLEEIARRKQALVAQCQRDREELASLRANLRLPMAATSMGFLIGKIMRSYPLLFTGLTGWLVSRRAKPLMRSARRIRGGLNWWRAAYPLWSLWSKLRRRKSPHAGAEKH